MYAPLGGRALASILPRCERDVRDSRIAVYRISTCISRSFLRALPDLILLQLKTEESRARRKEKERDRDRDRDREHRLRAYFERIARRTNLRN